MFLIVVLCLATRSAAFMKVGLVLLVGLLAACTAPRETFIAARPGVIGDSRANHAAQLVFHEASDGIVPVVIRGDPFAGRVVDPDAIVAEALRLPPGFPRASFIQAEKAEEGRGGRLVLVFDAENPNLEVRQMCQDLDAVEVGEADGRLRLSAAFCIGERVARGAVGATPRPQAMSEEFKGFLDRVLNEVFPFLGRLGP